MFSNFQDEMIANVYACRPSPAFAGLHIVSNDRIRIMSDHSYSSLKLEAKPDGGTLQWAIKNKMDLEGLI